MKGYLTEETSLTSNGTNSSQKETRRGSRARSRSRSKDMTNTSVVGPLKSHAKPKRSLSAGGRFGNTPGPRALMSASKSKTPLVKSNSDLQQTLGHTSRSKYRTPMKQRPKASSADRIGTITPKCQPNTPMAILRHARAGETVFSVTGSPVVTAK